MSTQKSDAKSGAATHISANSNSKPTQQPEPTTIWVAQDDETGIWTATQDGVDVVGEGDTAPWAVADYAERVARRQDAGEL